MKWHHIGLIAVVSIASVVAFVYIFGGKSIPVLSPAANRLGGGR